LQLGDRTAFTLNYKDNSCLPLVYFDATLVTSFILSAIPN
jgi:hypothetical protein